MKFSKLRKFALLFTCIIVLGQLLVGQVGTDSPYSRFGIGQLKSKNINTQLLSMGGIANAVATPRFVNPANPALYTKFDSLTFLFDAGFSMSSVTYSTTALSEKGSNASLSYVSLGFPVTRWWKIAVGLLPFSDVSYNVVVSDRNDEIGKYNTAFTGDGGMNQLFFGNGFRLNKNFSVGANITYVFGQNTTTTTLYFPDSIYRLSTRKESNLQANDLMFEYGFLYSGKLKNDINLNIGVTYGQQIKLNVKNEVFVRSMMGGIGSVSEEIVDTIFYSPKQKSKITLPHSIGFGVVLSKDYRWLVGADFNWQQWKGVTIGTVNDSLQNAWNVAIGGEYTPFSTSISKYWKRITYRMGARYSQTYLNLYGHSINEVGISFGVGLPLPRTLSTVNLGLEFGRGGTKKDNLIQETFINLSVGVSINERWFVKRKYN